MYNRPMPIKNITAHERILPQNPSARKQLCWEMTAAEATSWEALRTNKPGVHFRRQQIVAGFMSISTATRRDGRSKLMGVSTAPAWAGSG